MVSESQDRQIEHDAIKSEVVLPKKKKNTVDVSNVGPSGPKKLDRI